MDAAHPMHSWIADFNTHRAVVLSCKIFGEFECQLVYHTGVRTEEEFQRIVAELSFLGTITHSNSRQIAFISNDGLRSAIETAVSSRKWRTIQTRPSPSGPETRRPSCNNTQGGSVYDHPGFM